MSEGYGKVSQGQLENLLGNNGELQQSTVFSKNVDFVSSETQRTSREKWDKEIEFLFSCIALSVGLGNVWRFPFIALENGGGAFIIPYLIVLLLIGRPVYYMEVIIGQFSSRGCIKAFDMVPIMRGVAYGQVYATALATTYYACIMALTLKYLFSSFTEILPWTYCRPEWGTYCIATDVMDSNNLTAGMGRSSAELFFTETVLREKQNIEDGVGIPNWDLVLCLLIAWVLIATILIKGIRSSGKVSYFLALFPYIIMFILLYRALTLPGAMDGIIYFLKPQWDQLLNPTVWYAAITQMFFSLAICFGTLVMYASFNNVKRNVYKDVIIITSVDSLTSMLAGCIIFGILGNLAHEINASSIGNVIKGGAGLAFISYPEAIAKFTYMPQVFAVLFFFMLLVLGIGSNIGMTSCIITVIKDHFTNVPHWLLASVVSLTGFLCGIVYLTPGGQFILNLVDYFGCSFIALFLAIAELLAVSWIYGVQRLCKDIEFMFGVKTGCYWRICWGIITPGLMFVVLVYTLVSYEPLKYKNIQYPQWAYIIAWIIWGIGVFQVPLWAAIEIYKQPADALYEKIKLALKPKPSWGPLEPRLYAEYLLFRKKDATTKKSSNFFLKLHDNIFDSFQP